MDFLLWLAAAVAPAAFLLHFVYVRDKYEPEPRLLLLRVYFVSFLTVVTALLLEVILGLSLSQMPQNVVAILFKAFVVAALVEEGIKFLFLRWLAFHRSEFNEPYDGILYAVAVSLGFATVENIFYVLGASTLGGTPLGVALLRALTAVPGHALWGVMMGFYIGRATFTADATVRRRLWSSGLLVPVLAHGFYDTLTFSGEAAAAAGTAGIAALFLLGVFALVAAMWRSGVRMLRQAQAASPFQRPHPLQQPVAAARDITHRFCTRCGARVRRTDLFCHSCGADLSRQAGSP